MTQDEIRNQISNLGTVLAAGPAGLFVLDQVQNKFPVPWALIAFTWWLIPIGIVMKCIPGIIATRIDGWINKPKDANATPEPPKP